jgi:mannosyltransferase OCH1-like enzyme
MEYYTIAGLILISIIIFLSYKYYELSYKINAKIKNPPNSNNLVKNANIPTTTTDKIPRIIIQTWKTENIPQRYMKLINSIKLNNPDYEYLFFTDESIEEFLKTHYPSYYNTYKKLPIKIQKIDFFRYVAVYHFGGFYMDLDMMCLKSFDPLLANDCIFPIDEVINNAMCRLNRYKPFCSKGYYYLLGQYAFAASPKHPFIKVIIDKIHNNVNKYIKYVNFDSEDYVYKTTGPDFVTEEYINYKDKDSIVVLNNGVRQYFGDYAKHFFFGSWK